MRTHQKTQLAQTSCGLAHHASSWWYGLPRHRHAGLTPSSWRARAAPTRAGSPKPHPCRGCCTRDVGATGRHRPGGNSRAPARGGGLLRASCRCLVTWYVRRTLQGAASGPSDALRLGLLARARPVHVAPDAGCQLLRARRLRGADRRVDRVRPGGARLPHDHAAVALVLRRRLRAADSRRRSAGTICLRGLADALGGAHVPRRRDIDPAAVGARLLARLRLVGRPRAPRPRRGSPRALQPARRLRRAFATRREARRGRPRPAGGAARAARLV